MNRFTTWSDDLNCQPLGPPVLRNSVATRRAAEFLQKEKKKCTLEIDFVLSINLRLVVENADLKDKCAAQEKEIAKLKSTQAENGKLKALSCEKDKKIATCRVRIPAHVRTVSLDDRPLDFGPYKGMTARVIAKANPGYIVQDWRTLWEQNLCSRGLYEACILQTKHAK